MAIAFAHQHSPQHQSPLLAHHHTNHMAAAGGGGGGGVNLQDWLKAWKAWAGTRKRGKMAQFIVQKLEENIQARWLDITLGKFELTEWHNIADEWFKEKPRSSDQVDAPCMLRKGLPRAFPGLEEVKTESIKEGTQYRSRVFKATPSLVQEVQLYVNKPGGGYTNGSLSPYYNQQTDGNAYNPVSGTYMSLNPPPSIMSSQFSPPVNTSMYGSPHATTHHPTNSYSNPINASPLKLKATDEVFNQSFNPGPINMPSPSGSGSGSGAHVKLEESSPYSVHNSSPYSSSGVYRDSDVERSPAPSDSASPYTYANHSDASSLFNGGVSNLSPGMNSQMSNENQVFESYDHISESGSGGVMSPATYPYGTMLQVPTSVDGLMVNDLNDGSSGGSSGGGGGGGDGVWNGGNMSSSPHYSPEPNNFQTSTNPLTVDMSQSQSVVSPPVIVPPLQPAVQQSQQQVFLEVKPYPDKSPLEGGGQLALIFGGQLPCGPKWLSFNSQQRPEYIHQVEALEENFMALSTIIPKHDIPETLTLQVICSGQIVAQTDFTYYANAQYNSDQLFHYLVHNFPDYFPEMGGNRGGLDGSEIGGGLGGGGDGYSGGGGGYYGDIPSTSYNLLLGSCRLGIEELVSATLQLPSMIPINTEQLRKAHQLCEEHNHSKLVEVMQVLVNLSEITSRGGENDEGVVKTKEGFEVVSKLDSSLTAEDGGLKIISRLVQIHKMSQRFKLEEEREQQVVPASPTVLPASPVPSSTDNTDMQDGGAEETENSSQRRRSSRLQRQEKSVREEEEHIAPSGRAYSRVSIAEKDDHLPPLQPLQPNNRRGLRKPLISTYSDAADSAVSMSFDREGDFEQEVARRNSASLALSGLYSLNMSSIDGSALNIDIDPEAGYTFANSLQYECMYQVTDDYPPHSDAINIIFKAGDRIIQIGDSYVRDKGPDDFAELLQKEAVKGTSVRIIPRVSPPPSASVSSSIGYGSMSSTASARSLAHKPTDHQIMDTITMKVSNLLSMKGPGFKRSVTLPYCNSDKCFGFKYIGGNAVGLFISEVKGSRKEVQVGDQILELAGQNAVQMSYYEASEIISQNKDKLHLKVTQNTAKYHSIRDQFELESFFVRSHVDHTPTDSKDMTLTKGTLVRVVNSLLYPDAWLAWSVDESTGIDMELKRIPSPAKAYQQFGKHIYQSVEGPQDVMVS